LISITARAGTPDYRAALENRKRFMSETGDEFSAARGTGPLETCYLYGLRLRSSWRLPSHARSEPTLGEVELFDGPFALFERISREALANANGKGWCRRGRTRDGLTYLLWPGLFEFVVSADGRRVAGRPLADASPEAFRTYLLSQVISFALLGQGIESLHATVLEVEGGAVAFLGDCGYGKSTLAAAFLGAGHRLLTDDLLVAKPNPDGVLAFPGPPRIKLFPEPARCFLGDVSGPSMNGLTPKQVIPLGPGQSVSAPRPLRAFYVLRPPADQSRRSRVTVRRLSPRHAVLRLLANTFNAAVRDPARLARQFAAASLLATTVPVKSLSYPRDLSQLPFVVEAVRSDLVRQGQASRSPALAVS
jgi:hypothetical protein